MFDSEGLDFPPKLWVCLIEYLIHKLIKLILIPNTVASFHAILKLTPFLLVSGGIREFGSCRPVYSPSWKIDISGEKIFGEVR